MSAERLNEKLKYETIKGRNTIDYMLRTTQQAHSMLSQMADQKANIILAASSIILSVSLSNAGLRQMHWGLWTLATFTMVASVLAIMAVMPLFNPKVAGKTINQKFNPIFFAHFSKLTLPEFEDKMLEILHSDEKAYATIVNDIYQVGQVLYHKKYRYLRLSYSTFLIGIILSVLVMGVQKLFFLS